MDQGYENTKRQLANIDSAWVNVPQPTLDMMASDTVSDLDGIQVLKLYSGKKHTEIDLNSSSYRSENPLVYIKGESRLYYIQVFVRHYWNSIDSKDYKTSESYIMLMLFISNEAEVNSDIMTADQIRCIKEVIANEESTEDSYYLETKALSEAMKMVPLPEWKTTK